MQLKTCPFPVIVFSKKIIYAENSKQLHGNFPFYLQERRDVKVIISVCSSWWQRFMDLNVRKIFSQPNNDGNVN